MRGHLLVGLLLLTAVTGCSDGGRACTEIGSQHGLSVTVGLDVAPISDLVLSVCVDDRCTDHPVALDPGTSVESNDDCTDGGPDSSCSGQVGPDGTQSGFVTVDLPEGDVEVSGHYRLVGRTVDLDAATVDAATSYPNGRDCGADGTQAAVTLDGGGLH